MAKIRLTNDTIPITYSELVTLRDSGGLYPGATYRITDYMCTSSDSNTSAKGYKFDILVKAIDTAKLSEHCGALRNASDSHFPNETNFDAWEVWYCLDNDATRFDWASSTGKGVIYRLIDEFGNDCPYDFKNITFKRTVSWFSSHTDWCNQVLGGIPSGDKLYFTFSIISGAFSDGVDLSTNYYNGQKCFKFFQNKIAPYYYNNVQVLNSNVFILKSSSNVACFSNNFGNGCYNNTFGNSCHSNNFGNGCYNNTFGNQCYTITFGNGCFSNNFGNSCHSNNFGNGCHSNNFGNGCYTNTFGNNCHSNNFGNGCYSNTFVNDCHSNTFGNNCYTNTFGNDCFSSTFGTDCYSNDFGNSCYINTFGNYCHSNTFGNSCYSNTFGNYCHSNTFGNRCYNNIFGESLTTLQSYCRFNHFEDGVNYTSFFASQETSTSAYLQNITIHQGVAGSESRRRTIDVTEVNRPYNREYGNNERGSFVTWVTTSQTINS